MPTGLWTAASGAGAQSQSVDIVANNLANVDTTGFKKDGPTFREYLASVERVHGTEDIPRGAIKEKEFYPLDGRDQSFVVVDGTYTSFRQGSFRPTNSPLDLALEGPGFLEVSTPAGIRYTRAGNLKVGLDGKLVTNDGHAILSAGPGGLATGADPAARFINLRDRNRININTQGEIWSGDELVGRLSVVEFKDLNKVKKRGGSLLENTEPNNFADTRPVTLVRQGALENSNVNPIEEMTNLIKANRLYEHDLKAIKTYNDLLGREANDLGKL